MIARPVRMAELSETDVARWLAFLDAYTSTATRPMVDRFLKALWGSRG